MMWRELKLERAPGVTSGLSLKDCAPGLNVVVGPNGIGKSTLSRAARAALWRSEPFEQSHVRGRVVSRGGEWTIEREGSAPPRWTGPDEREPRMPDDRFRSCFHLGLEDLLRQGGTEQAIARELRLEMSGRYDLDAVAVEERKRSANSHAVRAARKVLLEARSQVDRLEHTARELLHRERSLVPLKAELAEQTAATEDRVALQDLLRVADARTELESLREAVAADDELLSHFESQDDFQRLADFEDTRAQMRAEVTQLRAELEAASQKLLDLSLPTDGVDGAVLQEGAQRSRRIQRLNDELLPPLRTELAGLKGGLAGLPESTAPWSREDLEAAQNLLDRHAHVRAQLAGLTRALELAETDPTPRTGDPWRSVLALLEWCTAGSTDSTTAKGVFGALALAAALLIGLIAAGLAGLAVPAWAYLGPLVLVIGVALQSRGNGGSASAERTAAQRRYAETGSKAPSDWDEAGVRESLENLLESRAERDFESHLRTWSEGLGRQRKELQREAAELSASEAALRERLAAGEAGELDLRFLLRGMERDARRRGVREQVAELERELATELGGLQDLLESAGVGRAQDLASALARWDHFAARAAQEPALRQARDNAAARLNDAQARSARSSDQRESFLAARRVAEADVQRAIGLAPRFAEHRERRQRLEELERDATKARKNYAQREDLLALDAAELRARLNSGATAAERITELQNEIAAIEADVRRERSDTLLTQREVELRDAEEFMEETRDAVLEGVAMDTLLTEVQARHRQEGRPRVLTRAEQHFADYTRNRYELEDFAGDELSVIETSTRRRLAPHELSSGTRTQLLIALRLAYAESIEGDDALPIFLDEALLTSDPTRFQEVARSLGRMVEEGRQVFYLTAEPREEVEWREALGTAKVPMQVHDLGGQLEALRRVAGSSLELAPLPEVPAPVGGDSASYARALGGLPAIDGFESADALHLLQLYWDRPQVAHLVLREHRSQVGAVRAFLDQTSQSPWDVAERERFDAYVMLADRVLGLWRVGRAPRLDAETLRSSTLAKSSKLDEVVALAAEVGWDGDALLAALDDKGVKNLHKKTIDELREDLEARQLLAGGTPLGFDDLLARALNDAEPHIERGALNREDARQLAHRLYQWLTSPESDPA
jgi:hypothetical protein